MNILVTGCNGQLGSEIGLFVHHALLTDKVFKHKFIFTDINIEDEVDAPYFKIANLNITNFDDVLDLIRHDKVDLIINCAAYTNVDKAEDEKELAYLVNTNAVSNLAKAASEVGAKMIHISTDYVFNGKGYKPYSENDITNPIGVYGASKRDGEILLHDILGDNGIVIRTAWLYSNFGKNFVKTIVNLGKTNDEIKVIFDQIGSPTYASDLAEVILKIMRSLENGKWVGGIYHYTNEGVCSWYDFAKEIIDIFNLKCVVKPIHTSEYPTPAKRPHYSVLDKTKIKNTYGIEIPHWKDSLRKYYVYASCT